MDILDNIDKFINNDEHERGIVIENVDDMPKSNYLQVEGDNEDISTTNLESVQPMPEDSWENMDHSITEWAEFRELVESGVSSEDAINKIIMDSTIGIPEVKIGKPKSKKAKKKRKQAKASRKKNRKR